MAAANTVMEWGGKVVLLDKSAFCGGNSTKATSGIRKTIVRTCRDFRPITTFCWCFNGVNGANTKTQRALGIQDSIELL